jgi:hypothetical protein
MMRHIGHIIMLPEHNFLYVHVLVILKIDKVGSVMIYKHHRFDFCYHVF